MELETGRFKRNAASVHGPPVQLHGVGRRSKFVRILGTEVSQTVDWLGLRSKTSLALGLQSAPHLESHRPFCAHLTPWSARHQAHDLRSSSKCSEIAAVPPPPTIDAPPGRASVYC